MKKYLSKQFVLQLILLVLVIPDIRSQELDIYWENIPSELHDRYNQANQQILEDWVLHFADSLDMKARELDNLRLKMFAAQIRSHYAFYKNDSATYIYNNDKAMTLAREANAIPYYYTEKLGRVMFYNRNKHPHLALVTVQEILKEAKEDNNLQGIYFGYMSMCYYYTTKRSPQQAIENGLKAAECLDMMDKPHEWSKAYIYSQLAINYLNVRNYEKCIKNIKTAIKYNNSFPDMYCTLCKAYLEMEDYPNFRESAKSYMEYRESSGPMFTTAEENVIKALSAIVDKNYTKALTLIDSINSKEDQMYCQLALYKSQNDWKKAYQQQEMISQYEDSLEMSMHSEEITDMSTELDTLYKEKEKEELLMRQRYYVIISGIIILAVIITSIIFILRYRTIKHKNKALAHNIDKLIKYKQKVLELENEKYGKQPVPTLNDELMDMKLNNNKENDENEEEEDDEDTELTAEDDSASSATTEDFTSIERFIYELTSRKLFTDINFNRDALLDELHIQKRTFTKKFEAYTGNSFKEYITSLRLEYAAQLIKEHPEYTIEAIAMECGIASYVTFHRNFTRHFGIAPSSYRQQ